MRLSHWLLAISLVGSACSHNPYLDASLARYQGKEKAWVEKELGQPDARSARFFGGEKWTYHRIAGGKTALPLFNFNAAECQLVLFFDRDDLVSDSNYSGC